MKYEQIENWLNKQTDADCVDVELSGMSRSSYISFCNPEGDIFKIRLSNHNLPVSYNHDFNFDYRFEDSLKELKEEVLNKCGLTKIVCHRVKEQMPSKEDVAFLKTEYDAFNQSMKRLAGAYQLSEKKQEFLLKAFAN